MTFMDPNEVIDSIWILKLIFLIIVSFIAGWHFTARIENDNSLRVALALLIGLTILPLLSVLHVHLSVTTHMFTVCVVFIIGFFYQRNLEATPYYLSSLSFKFQNFIIIGVSLIILIAGLRWVGLVSHWDHLLAPSIYAIDYARTGYPFSDWIGQNVTGRWVIAQQTTALAMDAFEMLWFGTFTAALSKYTTLLHIVIIAILIGKPYRWPSILFLAVLSIYAADQLVAFRPHIYIGMLLVIFVLLKEKHPKSILLMAFVCIAIFLSKRDGVIIAPIVAALIFGNKGRLIAIICGLPLIFLGGMIAKIGGVSVSTIFWDNIVNPSVILKAITSLANHNYYTPLFLMALVFSLQYRKIKLLHSLQIIIIVSLVVLFSAVILIGEERYNFGTISRKIEYFLIPVLLLFCYQVIDHFSITRQPKLSSLSGYMSNPKANLINLMHRINSIGFSLSKARSSGVKMTTLFFTVTAIVSLVYYSSNPVIKKISEFNYTLKNTSNWTSTVIENIQLYRSFFPRYAHLNVGFLYQGPESFKATPFKELDLYKFPFLQAYNGENLKIRGNINDLLDRDIIFLSHEVEEQHALNYSIATGFTLRYMYGGMKVLLSKRGEEKFDSRFLLTNRDGTAVTKFLTELWLPEEKLTWRKGFGFRSYFTQWNPQQYQYKVVWPVDPYTWIEAASIEFKNTNNNFVQMLSFKPHPMGDALPSSVTIKTKSGQYHYELKDLFLKGNYFIPIETSDWFIIEMYSDNVKSEFWEAPYFSIFNVSALAICEPEFCDLR